MSTGSSSPPYDSQTTTFCLEVAAPSTAPICGRRVGLWEPEDELAAGLAGGAAGGAAGGRADLGTQRGAGLWRRPQRDGGASGDLLQDLLRIRVVEVQHLHLHVRLGQPARKRLPPNRPLRARTDRTEREAQGSIQPARCATPPPRPLSVLTWLRRSLKP